MSERIFCYDCLWCKVKSPKYGYQFGERIDCIKTGQSESVEYTEKCKNYYSIKELIKNRNESIDIIMNNHNTQIELLRKSIKILQGGKDV